MSRVRIPSWDRFKCEICGRSFYGLMNFASHTAQVHGISATEYWRKYGHHGECGDKNINPSKRSQE